MLVPNPTVEASADLEERVQQLSELHSQLKDLDINGLEASHHRKQKINNAAAKNEGWDETVNQTFKHYKCMFNDGQKLLGTIEFDTDGIKVTFGTEDDQKNIDNAWGDHMQEMVAQNTGMAFIQREQRQEILKAIDVIRGCDLEAELSAVANRDETPTINAQSAVEAQKAFDSNAVVESKLCIMRSIAKRTVYSEKKRLKGE
ncbi:hypothetical protein DSL72_007838 [Monilinia vaccinii-corymbosi]|uniref:Uncharacterized protein n=1 Tax=Monilinia vaccinii-corymbosi TaxID=61207 RepID=A0A8A3PJ63_9HELO|nr:hypothetical protein DSL72_007838 [Monilinia vaccinii-corymbosi]